MRVYRAEIDGLRALAVIPVILFHAGFDLFRGGFIGVDVFFVISGYLITGIIHSEILEKNFSLIKFYERRARRILPALFIVLTVCIPPAWLWMLPVEFDNFSRSILATNLFISNILFWQESGYFASTAELKPLLHTWSLAVEEQFYIFFPLLLLLFRNIRKNNLILLLLSLTVLSLALSEWGARHYPDANFYLLPTRAWELGIGGLIAITNGFWIKTPARISQVGALLGIAAICFSILFFDQTIPFPSFWALIPVLGTGAVIAFARSGTFVAQLLSWRPIVFVGLLSYSLYLWHQPLFAFARIRLYEGVTLPVIYGLIVASFLLAYLSWRFIEQPFRNKALYNRSQIFTFSGMGVSILLAAGFFGHFSGGFPERFPSEHRDLDIRISANFGLSSACEFREKFAEKPECMTSKDPTLLVWGDSYAMHLVPGILTANPNIEMAQATKSKCGPIVDIAPTNTQYPPFWGDKCLSFNASVLSYLSKSQTISDVILSSPLDQYTSGEFDYWTKNGLLKWNSDLALEALVSTVRKIEALGKRVWILSPPAKNGMNLGLCLARTSYLGDDLSTCNFNKTEHLEAQQSVLKFIDKLEEADLKVVRLPNVTCKDGVCLSSIDGLFLYRDSGHLSREGSEWIGLNTTALALTSQIADNRRP